MDQENNLKNEDFDVFVLENIFSRIEHILNVFNENKFNNTGKALMFFIIKMHYIKLSIMRCKEVNDFYSSCILYRPFLEHYFKYMYIYSRSLKEDNDLVGKQYYNELKCYEDLTSIISMQNLDKTISDPKTIWKTGGKHNKIINETANQFRIKSILAYLYDGIDNAETKSIFGSYFMDSCKKYYDLSSFVHGGPFAESYFKFYSVDKEKVNKDLDYFTQTSEELFRRVVESSLLFLSLLDKRFKSDYNSVKEFKSSL